jgi:hypothetical protein
MSTLNVKRATATVMLLLSSGVMMVAMPTPSSAGPITFTKVADTTTAIPGGPGNFTGFGSVSMDGGEIAFVGTGSNWGGVYLFRNGVVAEIADQNTVMPDRGILFSSFSGPVSINSDNIAFVASGTTGGGVYTNLGGTLRAVASYAMTPIPDGTGNFTGMDQPSISGANIAFNGYGSNEQAGVYIEKNGSLSKVVDTNTDIPSGTGKFANISGTPGKLDGDNVAFRGSASTQDGIYTSIGGILAMVADKNTAIPNGIGNFTNFDSPAIDSGAVTFHGRGANSQYGIYTNRGGALAAVADTNTAIPEGTGTFGGFESYPSIDGNNIAFVASFAGRHAQDGIYVSLDGCLMNIVDIDDTLDGKHPNWFGMSPQSLSDSSLAFRVWFTDGSEGIYAATLPEPSTIALLGTGGIFLAGWAWRRRRSIRRFRPNPI